MNKRSKKLEVLLWSIALPGFGQLLNRKYIKGVLLIGLEFLVNVFSNLNQVIILSFHGRIEEAINATDYLWLMFYPCLYIFAIWDAYRDAGGGESPFAYLPFVCSTYIMTIGLIFSPVFSLFGHLLGPVWLPILSIPVGLSIGACIQFILIKANYRHSPPPL